MTHDHDLINEPVPHLLRSLAIPTSIGLFFNTMFNVVDTFFAARLSTQAIAALSLSFPVFFLIIAVGAGISSGATALIGHAVGADREGEAKQYAVQTLSFGLLHGILLTVLGRLGAPHLLQLLGASGEYFEMARAYMDVIFVGGLFFILNYCCNSILNATGDTRSFRNFLVTGFFLNLVLDPLLIFGGLGIPPLGLRGIAWSTVSVQLCGNIYLFLRARRTGLLSELSLKELLPRRGPYRELARLGFPASLNMLTVAAGFFVITWFISRYGKEAVAAYGIGTRIEQAVLLPVMGLNIATLALVSQNSGAKRFDRVRTVITTALKAGVGLMSIGTIGVFLLAGQLVRLFTKDPAVIYRGAEFLHVESLVFAAYVILYTSVYALQGLKRPLFAVWIGIFRQVAAPLPLFFLFAGEFQWGIRGVWWAIFLVTWSAACCAILYIRRVLQGLAGDAAGT